LDRVSDDSLLMEMASLRLRVKLACWVEVASRKAWVAMRFKEISVKSDFNFAATKDAMREEDLSTTLSSMRLAVARIMLIASTDILGSRDTVRRISAILDRLYALPLRTHPLVLSHLRASEGLVTGPGLPEINVLISECVARLCWEPLGVPSQVGALAALLVFLNLSLSLSMARSLGGQEG